MAPPFVPPLTAGSALALARRSGNASQATMLARRAQRAKCRRVIKLLPTGALHASAATPAALAACKRGARRAVAA
jgi:hypothetical protein